MKNTIKRIFGAVIVSSVLASSCTEFLTEHPTTFLSPDSYYTTESQMQAAVNGLYTGLSNIFTGGVGVGVSPYHMLELITGGVDRTQPGSDEDLGIKIPIKETNTYVASMWREVYAAINNCNSVIAGLEASTADVTESTKSNFIGEAYFLRAWYYFQLVRLYGPIPLFTEETADLSNTQAELSSEADVYAVIVSDLQKAESSLSDWIRTDGHASKGAATSLLAKVYLTMAGYPLQQTSHYADAYTEAKKVIDCKAFSLFSSYADLRDESNENRGEFIFSLQRESENASSGMHTSCLPYPVPSSAIAENNAYGGCVIPTTAFYGSYDSADLRLEDGKGYFYTHYAALDGSGDVTFSRPYIFKFFDTGAVTSGKSGLDYPFIRYADVLLVAAEAKAMADGGTTTDATAVDAYYQVRHRAMPNEIKPASVSFNEIYKERYWELCFETQTWYDMIRTRKAFKFDSGTIVDLIGYQAPNHDVAFTADDMYLPYPSHDRLLNPNLTR